MTTHPVSKSTQTGISCHSASTSMSSRTGETAMCLLIAIVAVLFYQQYSCNFNWSLSNRNKRIEALCCIASCQRRHWDYNWQLSCQCTGEQYHLSLGTEINTHRSYKDRVADNQSCISLSFHNMGPLLLKDIRPRYRTGKQFHYDILIGPGWIWLPAYQASNTASIWYMRISG